MAYTDSLPLNENKNLQYQELNNNKTNIISKKQIPDTQKKLKEEEIRKNEFKKQLNKDLVGTISKEAYFQEEENLNKALEIKKYTIKQNINANQQNLQRQENLVNQKQKRSSIPLHTVAQSTANQNNQKNQMNVILKSQINNQKYFGNDQIRRNQYQTQQSYTIQDLNNFYFQYGGQIQQKENSANLEPSSEHLKQITPGTTDIDLTQNSAYGQIHQLTAQIQVRKSQLDIRNSQIADSSSRLKEDDSKATNIMNQSYKILSQVKNSIISNNSGQDQKFNKICPRQLNQSNRPKSQGHPFGTKKLGKKTYQHSDIAQYQQFILNQKLRSINNNENNIQNDNFDGSTINMGEETLRFLQQAGACKEVIRYNTKGMKQGDKGIFNQVAQKMKEVFNSNSKTLKSTKKSNQETIVTKRIEENQDIKSGNKPKRKSVLIEINSQNRNFKSETFNTNSLYQQYFTPACRLINQQRFLNNLHNKLNYKKQDNFEILLDGNQMSSQIDDKYKYSGKIDDLLQINNQLNKVVKPKLQLLKVTQKIGDQNRNQKEFIFNKPVIHFKLDRGSITQLQSITLEKEHEESTQTARILISKTNQNQIELVQPQVKDINVYNNLNI